MKKKLLFNLTEDWFFCSHFFERALAAKKAGYSIFVISKENSSRKFIEDNGIFFIPIPFNRRSINPIYELFILIRIIIVYANIKPDIVHQISAKPIIYGSIAARLCKIKSVINAPVGLGYVFSSDALKAKALKPIVHWLLKIFLNSHYGKNKKNKVIFENNDDLSYFVKIGAVKQKDACLIRGAGVNIKNLVQYEKEKKTTTITFIGRMLKDKGINEFISAARILKGKSISARFVLAGDVDPLNPTSLKKKTLLRWSAEKNIHWLGWVDDIESVLKETDILCLPSYREGLPKALIEGAAFGLPIVTTNTVGCRDVVEDGLNGYLVPIKNAEELADKILKLILDKNLRIKMGKESFKIASSKFSSKKIVAQTLRLYKDLIY